jgi:hypothetical protein
MKVKRPSNPGCLATPRCDSHCQVAAGHSPGEGSAQVDLDYVVPRYQGFTLGEFVYRPDGPLAARGYRRAIAPPRMQNAGDYLTDVGFRPEGDAMVRAGSL